MDCCVVGRAGKPQKKLLFAFFAFSAPLRYPWRPWHSYPPIDTDLHRLRKTTENTEISSLRLWARRCLAPTLRLCVNLGALCALGDLGVNRFALSAPLFSLRLCVTSLATLALICVICGFYLYQKKNMRRHAAACS